MEFDPKLHHRHSTRLQTYDYTQAGAYFVTLCAHDRKHLFGEIVNGEMILNRTGRIVVEEWFKSAALRKEIRLDAFIVMPNHIHGIVLIDQIGDVGAHGRAPHSRMSQSVHDNQQSSNDPILFRPRRSLGTFIAGFKSTVTSKVNNLQKTPGHPLWQRNYYDHIIRKEESLERIRHYIAHNPQNWDKDKNNLLENVWL